MDLSILNDLVAAKDELLKEQEKANRAAEESALAERNSPTSRIRTTTGYKNP